MIIEKCNDLKIQVKCRYLNSFFSCSHPSEERNRCSHIVAMNQAAFKILSVAPGGGGDFPWGFPNSATDLFYMLKYHYHNHPPSDGLPQKYSQKCVDSDFTSSISHVPFCVAAPVSFPYEFSVSSQTRPWRFSLSSMPLVCHLAPLLPAGIPLVWVEREDSSICATMPLYSQSKCEMCGPGVPLLCIHSPPNLNLLPW